MTGGEGANKGEKSVICISIGTHMWGLLFKLGGPGAVRTGCRSREAINLESSLPIVERQCEFTL